MDKKYLTWIALGVGVVGLWWFYRSRQGLSLIPGRGQPPPPPAGGYAQGSGPGTIVLPRNPVPSGTSINDPAIVAARGAATGSGSRALCGLRWIKTVDGPYYGLCVSENDLNRWNAMAGGLANTATTAQVKSTLGLR